MTEFITALVEQSHAGSYMQLKNLLSVSAVAAALAGCASGPDLTKVSDLKVYPDNRIGYTLLSNGTQPARVWSTGETILALRFGSRIINAKDLDYVTAQRTNKKYVPLHITAQLKSGEAMVADVSDWGMSAYSDMTVEWLACGKEKKCVPLFPGVGSVKFTRPSNFLAFFSENGFESLLMPGTKLQDLVTYEHSRALPPHSDYRLNFVDVSQAMDLSAGIEAARANREKLDKCNAAAVAARNRERKLTEEKIIATTAPADVQRKLAEWHATLRNQTSDMVGWDAGCTSQ